MDSLLEGACAASGAALDGLPRFDRAMGSVEADWSLLPTPLGVCLSDSLEQEICLKNDILFGPGADSDFATAAVDAVTGGDPATLPWVGLIQSYAIYGGLGGALAVISLLFLFVYILVRCLCCCCSSCCGRRDDAGDDAAAAKGVVSQKQGRSRRVRRVLGICSLFVFMCATAVLLALGNSKGNQGLTEAQRVLVKSAPRGVAALLASLPEGAAAAVGALGGGVLVTVAEALNATLTETVEFPVIMAAFRCIDSTLDSFSPATINALSAQMDQVVAAEAQFPDVAATQTLLARVDNVTGEIGAELVDVEAFVGGLKTALAALNLTAVDEAVSALNGTLAGELTPAMAHLKSALEDMRDHAPTSSAVTDTSDDVAAFRDAPDETLADAALASMAGLKADLELLPEDLGDRITRVQTLFDEAETALAALQTVFEATETDLAAVPDAAAVEAALAPLAALLEALSLDEMSTLVGTLATVIAQVPTGFGPAVAAITAAVADVPCIMRLEGQLARINASLVALPAEMADVSDQLATINETASAAGAQVAALNDTLGSVEGQVAALPNASAFQEEIDALRTRVADFNVTLAQVKAQAAGVDGDRAAVNLTELAAAVADVRAELGAGNPVRIDASQMASVQALNASRHDAVAALTAAAQVIEGWKTNFGSGAGASAGWAGACSDNLQQCGAGVTPPEPCAEAQCSYYSMKAALDATVAGLAALDTSLGAQPDFAALIGGLDDGAASIAAVPALDTSLLSALQSTIDGFLPSADAHVATIAQMRGSLETTATDLDLAGLSTQIADAGALLTSVAADMGSYQTTLGDLNATLSGGELREMVDAVLRLAESAEQLLFTDLGPLLDRIRGSALVEAIAADGFPAGVLLLANTVDAMAAPFADVSLNSSAPVAPPSNFTAAADAVRDFMYVLELLDAATDSTRALRDRGSLFYVVAVLARLDGGGPLPSEWGSDPAVFEAARGGSGGVLGVQGRFAAGSAAVAEEYAGAQLCLTDECLGNSITRYNTMPAVESIPLSREQAFMLLYLFPGLVLLAALLAFVCALRGRRCTGPFVVCGCLTAPFLFLFAGAVGTPLLLVLGDTCSYYEPAAVLAVEAVEPVLCETLSMNATADGHCLLELPGDAFLELDLGQLAKSLLMSCEGRSTANLRAPGAEPVEPVAALWQALRFAAPHILSDTVTELISGDENASEPLLRPDLEARIDDVVTNSSAHVDAVLEVLSDALDCEALAGVLSAITDPVCCELADSLFWLIVPWYGIALAVLFCALPAICCVPRKRLAPLSRVFVSPQ